MPPILTPQTLGRVVLESAEHGAYPDSEHVASAQLPPAAFPTLLDGLATARTEAEIRALSRQAAPDVDGWIAQAKLLQADIARSRATAHDIVQQAEAATTLHASVRDASSKAALLKSELAFNATLTATLERIKHASDLLDEAQSDAREHDIIAALDKMKQADDFTTHLGPFRDTRIAGVLHKRLNQLRDALAENATRAWNLLLVADIPGRSATINDQADKAGEEADEGWDAWDNDDSEKLSEATKAEDEKQGTLHVEEEDMDADAWGLDDDAEGDNATETKSEKGSKGNPEEEDTDAWGWGEDEEAGDAGAADNQKVVATQQQPSKPNGGTERSAPQERELTLREKYTVTGIPDAIMEVITQVIADAQALAQSKSVAFLPTGNMLAYNDSTRLVNEVRDFLVQQARTDESSDLPQSSKPSSRLRLDADLKAIESFSKRAYGKEMESQRTIVRDLLDGAQGFSNCTTAPFAAECDNAVSMTADRIRDVAKQWTGVLSHSALLQSLGSLLATVLNKMIVDIEDMSDISEEESKRLRDFCNRVCEVSDLFKQPGQQGDMTGIYTPNWFKFQYLSEILESSLADIKYLWTEGELKLEFEADEVVDLIEALFADSDYRRRAIADIRRHAR
ncbi:putative centromere kinetochore protein zw10 [Diplodia seriata]|uniref:Putative centromere kinetochore protein zw10 n=1 Tax=Diplodia seriata TaxID=420778 RepID=A0A0G2GM08_9PEZI|nr:putative centromere kinetochore protein zw10 [Diplodia seriata]